MNKILIEINNDKNIIKLFKTFKINIYKITYKANIIQIKVDKKDLNKIIDEVFAELKPESMKDMGRTVKEIAARTAGRADMSQVSAIVKSKLQ